MGNWESIYRIETLIQLVAGLGLGGVDSSRTFFCQREINTTEVGKQIGILISHARDLLHTSAGETVRYIGRYRDDGDRDRVSDVLVI